VDDAFVPTRTVIGIALAGLTLTVPAGATADHPGTYGPPPDRVCGVAADRMLQVGATRVSCSIARKVATGIVRDGKRFERWRCPGARKGSGYGHCHGKGPRRGAIVHWGLND
jgi:hypothetical protein